MGLSPSDSQWRERLPDLFVEHYVTYAGCRVTYTTDPVDETLVSRLHLVATVPDGRIIICRSVGDGWFLPGGTREPGETITELARRELMEEAGAKLVGAITLFGAHLATSERDKPYRPHLPFPHAAWAYATAPIQLVGGPLNPPDGEQVVEVLALDASQAIDYLADHDRMSADVLQHAIALGIA